MKKVKSRNYEALMWCIALPGFGQFINKKFGKGILFVLLEVVINIMASFNLAIVYSFNGFIDKAIEVTDFQWLMFYPCLYFYSLWDAYRDSNEHIGPYLYLPFVFSAYMVTVGLIYSTRITIFGYLLGPVFLPMLFTIPGIVIGLIIRKVAINISAKNEQIAID